MQLITPQWTISGASHIGHAHYANYKNCQDTFQIEAITEKDIVIGIVCDGCGEGKFSEAGSIILGQTCINSIKKHIAESVDYTDEKKLIIDSINKCFTSSITVINQIIHLINCKIYDEDNNKPITTEVLNSLVNCFLSTIIGVIATPTACYIFNAGDGVYATDDIIQQINHDDTPKYIGYRCIPNYQNLNISQDYIIDNFDIHEFTNPSKIMIATDGFNNHNINKISNWNAIDHQNQFPLHGHQWDHKGAFGLKKWLNVCFDRGCFIDDCAIVTVQKNLVSIV